MRAITLAVLAALTGSVHAQDDAQDTQAKILEQFAGGARRPVAVSELTAKSAFLYQYTGFHEPPQGRKLYRAQFGEVPDGTVLEAITVSGSTVTLVVDIPVAVTPSRGIDHRLPANSDDHFPRDRLVAWSASFSLPADLEPRFERRYSIRSGLARTAPLTKETARKLRRALRADSTPERAAALLGDIQRTRELLASVHELYGRYLEERKQTKRDKLEFGKLLDHVGTARSDPLTQTFTRTPVRGRTNSTSAVAALTGLYARTAAGLQELNRKLVSWLTLPNTRKGLSGHLGGTH